MIMINYIFTVINVRYDTHIHEDDSCYLVFIMHHAMVDTSEKLSTTVTSDTRKAQKNFYFIILSIMFMIYDFLIISIIFSFLHLSFRYTMCHIVLTYWQFNKDINRTQKPLEDMTAASELLRFRLPDAALQNWYKFI